VNRTVALALVVALALAVAGCGAKAPTAEEQKAACFQNIQLIQAEMRLFKADSGVDAPIQTVVDKLGVKCPSGGTYSWDPNAEVVSCSVHGKP
jgi:hypothetical protein